MNIIYPPSNLYIAQSNIHGLGIFARSDIKEGEIIEEAPILLIEEDQITDLTQTELRFYYFAWGAGFKQAAIGFGYASLYNHSYDPNARYIKDMENNLLRFVAIKNIESEQEILVNYNGHPDDKTKLWFEARESFQ